MPTNVAPTAPAAPNVGLTFVPAIQTPTMQTGVTTNGTTTRPNWLDYAMLVLLFIAVVNSVDG